MTQNVPLVMSINVHEKPQFLMKQLENIKSFVTDDFVIILNCNDYINNELKNFSLPHYVHINPDIINKQAWTGLITKGIYSNMQYALKNFNFMYFIILSSRNIFYNKMSCNDLVNSTVVHHARTKDLSDWHWPDFIKTKLAQYYLNKSIELHGCEHEGLVFTKNVCETIQNMLEKNIELREDLFKVRGSCVEEFALQTIATNEGNYQNGEFGRINICCGGAETPATVPTDPTMFIYKILRI
jgi:hypothetical protein